MTMAYSSMDVTSHEPDDSLDNQTSERSPLLNIAPSPGLDLNEPTKKAGFRLSERAIYCMMTFFLLELSNQVLTVPLISLFENAICEDYYHLRGSPGGRIDESNCKIAPVQIELAFIRGWQGFFNTVSAILVALPLGYVADRYDKRKVMAVILLGMLGALLWTILVVTVRTLPLRTVWVTSVFYLCGGGNYAAEIVLQAMIVNASNETNRTQTLYFMYSSFITTEIIGPAFASLTARTSIWVPFGAGILCLSSTFIALALMPEAPEVEQEFTRTGNSNSPTLRNSYNEASNSYSPVVTPMIETVSVILSFLKSRNMVLAVPIFLIGTFRGISLRVLLQYTSTKFGWKLADTNVLTTEVAVVNLVLFFFILPFVIGQVKKRCNPHPQVLNVFIIRYSLSILMTGSYLLFVAPNSVLLFMALAIYALGFGARTTLLSLVTSWFDPKIRARLYSTILFVELFGMLVGEALLQNLLAAAFNFPRFWFGIPFIASGTLYLLALVFSLLIRVPDLTYEFEQSL